MTITLFLVYYRAIMNRLPTQKRVQVVSALVEGSSINSIVRMSGVAKHTILKLLEDMGCACAAYHHRNVRGLRARRVVGRPQITTDAHKPYLAAIEMAFGDDVDYAQMHKIYGASGEVEGRYSPATCIGCDMKTVIGEPDYQHVSTSYVERQNLTMRMSMRRFTRLTNGFSKKIENHGHAVALHFMYYNFVRVHKTLRVTPAMEAGIADHVWSFEELVALLDAKVVTQAA